MGRRRRREDELPCVDHDPLNEGAVGKIPNHTESISRPKDPFKAS